MSEPQITRIKNDIYGLKYNSSMSSIKSVFVEDKVSVVQTNGRNNMKQILLFSLFIFNFTYTQDTLMVQGEVQGMFYIPECMCAPFVLVDDSMNINYAMGTTPYESVAYQEYADQQVIVTGVLSEYPCEGFCDEFQPALQVISIDLAETEPEVTLTFDCPDEVVAGSEGNVLPINVDTSEDVMGIMFNIPFDSSLIEITDFTPGEIFVESEMLSWSTSTDSLLIVLSFDLDGTPCVYAGSGNLFNLHYTVLGEVGDEINFEFTEVTASNSWGHQMDMNSSDTCTISVVEPSSNGPECIDLTGIDFGPCAMELGYAWDGDSCSSISGCGPEANGMDYSQWIFETFSQCGSACEEWTVHFTMESAEVSVGDTVEVNILVDNNAGNAGGIQLTIEYGIETIQLTNVEAGPHLPFDWMLSYSNNTIVAFSFSGTTLYMGDNLNLFKLYFTGLEEGETMDCPTDIIVSDPNGQPYSASYDCGIITVTDDCTILGDVNLDGEVNILDVVIAVNCAIGHCWEWMSECEIWALDVNEDGELNILDIVMIVNIILSGDTLPEDCFLEPDIGPCDGSCPKYFFDPDTEECEVFFWGCCEGVVPFDTLEECQDVCE